jgi:capsular polysaccharide biosynthesis protein
MEIREYIRILRRRAWIPLLLVLATVATAGVLAFTSPPQYTATATVVARGSGALTFGDVATSNSVLLKVLRQVNDNEPVDQLRSRIKVSSGRSDTSKVSVSHPEPAMATALANAVASQAAVLYRDLAGGAKSTIATDLEKNAAGFRTAYVAAATALLTFNRDHPDTVGGNPHPKDLNVGAQALELQLNEQAAADAYKQFEAEVTKARVEDLTNSNYFTANVVDEAAATADTTGRILKVVYPGALALLVGIAIIFILEYMDHSVREPEEVEALIGAPVVGIIPRATPRTLRGARGGAA